MANDARSSTSQPPPLSDLLDNAESAWRVLGCPEWRMVYYELAGKLIHTRIAPASRAFQQVRGWMNFMKHPSYTHRCVLDDHGRNENQYWNDLEVSICRYNIASVSQNLLWFSRTDKHSACPDHRRLPEGSQPAQPAPFPVELMAERWIVKAAEKSGEAA